MESAGLFEMSIFGIVDAIEVAGSLRLLVSQCYELK
jgi:hypothetical protein